VQVVQQSDEAADYAPDYEDLDWFDETAELAEVLRDALHDDFSDASSEEMDDALGEVLESMSPAESFNFAKALKQIERGAGQALSDPVFGQIVRTGLPIAAGAVGTVFGGPVGTALGSSLGTAAARALPGGAPTRPAAPTPDPGRPAVAGGSAAAAQGLVLTQQPDVLKGLLALAMGEHGKKSVNGVPVPAIMGMLSSVFGQAAADADELMYLDEEGSSNESEALPYDSEASPGRSLYTTLMDVDNYELAEAEEPS
jgi:hypothetical protein